MSHETPPWHSRSALLALRTQLYHHPPPSAQRAAISTILSWPPPLPPPLEATAFLTDAQLLDSNPSTSELSVRGAYASALARFVTALLDGAQRGQMRVSMRALAAQIGLPGEFVVLRHKAVHDVLPGREELRERAKDALDWIWERYWKRVGEGCADEEVGRVVREYKAARLRGGGRRGGLREARRCVRLVRQWGKEAADGIVRALLRPRFLVPAARRLGDSMRAAFLLWDDFLSLLGTVPAFTACLMAQLGAVLCSQAAEASREALYLWACRVLARDWGRAWAVAGGAGVRRLVQRCLFVRAPWGLKLVERLLGLSPGMAGDYAGMLEEAKKFVGGEVEEGEKGDEEEEGSLPSGVGEEELQLLEEEEHEYLFISASSSPEPIAVE